MKHAGSRIAGALLAVLAATACGGGSGAPSAGGGTKPPNRLVFTVQPSRVTAGKTFAAVVTVEVVATNGAKLLGSAAVAAVQGVARFRGLAVDLEGTGYTLRATAKDIVTSTSVAFDVEAAKRYAIVLIADGWGYKHIEATHFYTGSTMSHGSTRGLRIAFVAS